MFQKGKVEQIVRSVKQVSEQKNSQQFSPPGETHINVEVERTPNQYTITLEANWNNA